MCKYALLELPNTNTNTNTNGFGFNLDLDLDLHIADNLKTCEKMPDPPPLYSQK